jgi:hypothetical protein
MREQPTYAGAPEEGARGEYGQYGDGDPRERQAPAYDGPPREGRYQPPWWVRLIGTGLIVCLVLLLLGGIATGALALLAYTTPAASATSTQAFSVTGTPSVIVHAQAGSVSVVTGNADQVTMHATRSARAISSGLAQRALAAIHITATQDGNIITIEETRQSLDFWPGFIWRNVQIDLTVPRTTNLTATLNAGSLTADNLQGAAIVTANAGSIEFNNAQLSDASLHSDAGSITLSQVALSGSAHLSANAGSIELQGALAPHTTLDVGANAGSVSLTLPASTSAHLEATTNAGSISVEGWPITVQRDLARSSASGDLVPNPTGSITIHSNAGSISVSAG